jgi:hypothetical protein
VRTRLSLLVATLGLFVVTGCTTTSEGTPLPDSTSTSEAPSSHEPPSDDLPSDGDVRIAVSDANLGNKDPCDLAAQAASMMMKTMQEAA